MSTRGIVGMAVLLSWLAASGGSASAGEVWSDALIDARRLMQQEEPAKAQAAAEDSLRAAEAFGSPDPRIAEACELLGDIATGRSQLNRAEEMYRRALSIREASMGTDHALVEQTLRKLAETSVLQGRYPHAEELYRRVLTMREKALGKEHPLVAEILVMLTTVVVHQRRPGPARELQDRALAILDETVGSDSPIIADTLIMLAKGYIEEGYFDQAEGLLRKAQGIRERTLSAAHPLVAETLIMIAELHVKQGQPARAVGLYKRLAGIREKAHGAYHPKVADTFVRLAEIYLLLNDADGAQEPAERAFSIRKKVHGTAHPIVAKTAVLVAKVYTLQGTPEKIAEMVPPPPPEDTKPLAAREIQGPDTGTTREDLAVLKGVEDAASQELGKKRDYIILAESLANRGQIYAAIGQYTEAESLLRQALVIHEKILNSDHDGLSTVLENYAYVLKKTGREKEAEAIDERVRGIQSR